MAHLLDTVLSTRITLRLVYSDMMHLHLFMRNKTMLKQSVCSKKPVYGMKVFQFRLSLKREICSL